MNENYIFTLSDFVLLYKTRNALRGSWVVLLNVNGLNKQITCTLQCSTEVATLTESEHLTQDPLMFVFSLTSRRKVFIYNETNNNCSVLL